MRDFLRFDSFRVLQTGFSEHWQLVGTRMLKTFYIFSFATIFVHSLEYVPAENFKEFLISKYGKKIAKTIYRPDVFRSTMGGGNHVAGEQTKKVPVIFVHGVATKADQYQDIHRYFARMGRYTQAELYALTWSNAVGDILRAQCKCEHVKQIRRFIESVSEYTNSKVDVIAYSMGSPLTRKAILGGFCVENGEALGDPLTEMVYTYLSVGGANYGSRVCQKNDTKFCGEVIGLHCNSTYIQDINKQYRYEGTELFGIYNPNDEWIGDSSPCGIPPYRLNGADDMYEYPLPFHLAVLWLTKKEQLNFVQRKYRTEDFEKKRSRKKP